MKSLKSLKLIIICFFIVLIQFFTLNAGFTTSDGKFLRIERGYYTGEYFLKEGKVSLGAVSLKKISKLIKKIDYVNFPNLLSILKGDQRLNLSTLMDIRKAHLDIYALIVNVAFIALIKQGNPYHASEAIELIYFFLKQTAVSKAILKKEGAITAHIFASATGLHFLIGMTVEAVTRYIDFKKLEAGEKFIISEKLYSDIRRLLIICLEDN
jgi:hypothetical protein